MLVWVCAIRVMVVHEKALTQSYRFCKSTRIATFRVVTSQRGRPWAAIDAERPDGRGALHEPVAHPPGRLMAMRLLRCDVPAADHLGAERRHPVWGLSGPLATPSATPSPG